MARPDRGRAATASVLVASAIVSALGACNAFEGISFQPDAATDAPAAAPDAAGGADGDAASSLRARYEAAVLADGPLVLLPFDETSGGVAADRSGNGHDGTYAGSVKLGAPGAFDGSTAARFDAALEYVPIADAPFDFTGNAAFTLEAWVRPDSGDAQYRRVLSKDDPDFAGGRVGYSISVVDTSTSLPAGSAGLHVERFVQSAGSSCSADTTVRLGAFNYVVVAYDGATLKLYVDGHQAGTSGTGCPGVVLPDTTVPLVVGAQGAAVRGNSYGQFLGVIDEVAVYDKALTVAQVSAHWSAAQR